MYNILSQDDRLHINILLLCMYSISTPHIDILRRRKEVARSHKKV